MLTAQRLIERSLAAHGPRTAVVDGERRLTYAALAQRTARLANVLLAAGAGARQPAAALLGNCTEYVELDVACMRAGITRVGISERLSADEAHYILEHSSAALLVTTPELRERLGDVPDGVGTVLLTGADGGYEEALASASPVLDVAPVDPATPAYILYTSGTTGRPKGATHSQAGRVAATVNMLAAELSLAPDSVMLHAGPLTHGSGSKVIALLAVGGANVVLPRFSAEAFAAAARNERATHTFLVPTMIGRLLDGSPEVHDAVRSLRQISFGGSPIAPTLFRRAVESFGPILTQVYGSSEVPHPVTVLRLEGDWECDAERLLRSAGRAAVGTDVRVLDAAGHEVRAGEAGELMLAAPHVMQGYWDDPDATAEVLTEDGWYRTGDLVRLDGDGLVTFEDRARDLIITGGLNVYPSEVERVLMEHPAVREVAVLGYPDEAWGESIIAFVVPASPEPPDPEVLIDWVRERLAGYKKPRRVEYLAALPLGSSNKVLKKELRAQLWQGQERRVG